MRMHSKLTPSQIAQRGHGGMDAEKFALISEIYYQLKVCLHNDYGFLFTMPTTKWTRPTRCNERFKNNICKQQQQQQKNVHSPEQYELRAIAIAWEHKIQNKRIGNYSN